MAVASQSETSERTSSRTSGRIEASVPGSGLLVRWVVLFSGNPETDEYYPAASRGETEALTSEISKVCNAFHPTSQMQLFPRESPVWMFWKAKSTGDWIVTRVTVAPNLQGQRTTLEYCNLVFDESAFQALRCNPFRARSLNLHDRVRKHYIARRKEPFAYTLPTPAAAVDSAITSPEPWDIPEVLIEGHQTVISDIRRIIPGITEDHLADDANVGAIQEFCSRWQDRPEAPPTFATWWSSRNLVPDGRFDVVLRAAAPKAVTWHEAARSVAQLVNDVKLMLPNPPAADTATISLIRTILNTCTEAEQATNRAAARIHTETSGATQVQLDNVIELIKVLTTQLGALAQRFAGHLSPEETDRFTHLIDRSQDLHISLTLIVSHNPFQASGHRISTAKAPGAVSAKASGAVPAKASGAVSAKSSSAVSAFVSVQSQRSPGSHASHGMTPRQPALGNAGQAQPGNRWNRMLSRFQRAR